jgi:uncharacterized membrane protein
LTRQAISEQHGGDFPMTMWPTVLGFLVLMVLVVAMGTQSTRRYEQEQRAERTTGPRGAETMSPVSA